MFFKHEKIGRRANLDLLSVVFLKFYFPYRKSSPDFFVTFSIIISHIFPENFIFYLNSRIRSEDIRIFFLNKNYFHQYFGFLHSLVTVKLRKLRKLMVLACNTRSQHLFYLQRTLNKFIINCIKLC